MLVPATVGKVKRLPGSQTTVQNQDIDSIRPLFAATGSRKEVLQVIQFKQSQIAAAFYNDLFVMLSHR